MPKKIAPWSKLRVRLESPDRSDPTREWTMPIYADDLEAQRAWSEYASKLKVRYDAEDPNALVVAFDFPLITNMKRALSMAETLRKKMRPAYRTLIDRVITDLVSYRDTGRSHMAGVEEKWWADWEARKADARAARAAKKP